MPTWHVMLINWLHCNAMQWDQSGHYRTRKVITRSGFTRIQIREVIKGSGSARSLTDPQVHYRIRKVIIRSARSLSDPDLQGHYRIPICKVITRSGFTRSLPDLDLQDHYGILILKVINKSGSARSLPDPDLGLYWVSTSKMQWTQSDHYRIRKVIIRSGSARSLPDPDPHYWIWLFTKSPRCGELRL